VNIRQTVADFLHAASDALNPNAQAIGCPL